MPLQIEREERVEFEWRAVTTTRRRWRAEAADPLLTLTNESSAEPASVQVPQEDLAELIEFLTAIARDLRSP